MINPLQSALTEIARDLDALGHRWALVGGLAVSARAEPRTTRDVDVAVAVRDDGEAEEVIGGLQGRGYRVDAQLEQTAHGRLGAVRLLPPGSDPDSGLFVDLFFAVSGIELEVVSSAERIDLLEELRVPVARAPHLLALKVLAERPERVHDRHDARALIARLSPEEIELTRRLLALIAERGFSGNQDLQSKLDALIAEQSRSRYEG